MKRRLFPLLLVVSGCYGYYPVSAAAPAGREVQLMLTDSGSVVLSRAVGPAVESVSGRVTGDSSGTIVLAVTGTRKRDGVESDWKGERVAIPRALVANVSERKFSRARTALFSGALAVALVSIRQAFGGPGASSPGSGLPGGSGAK